MHTNFHLAFGALFGFLEANFHKIKGKKTLSRSHNYLNIPNNKGRVTESFSTPIELCNACPGNF
jgi:hypothetical protein